MLGRHPFTKVWQSHVPCFGPAIVVPRPGAMRAAAIRLPGQVAVNLKEMLR